MKISKVAKATASTDLVTFASGKICHAVVDGMVGANSSRDDGIKCRMGLMPSEPEGVGSTSNKAFMKMLP